MLDFTVPKATVEFAGLAANARIVHVFGTTGLTPEDEAKIAAAARHATIVRSGNMSLGVNLLTALTRKVAEALDADFDIEIVEMHHRHKVDAPSGTALMLGKAAADGRGVELDKVSVRGRDGHTGARRRGDIGFATLRGGSVVGEHSVIFAADGELIELTHRAADRGIFARGAVKAALWGRGKGPGLFSMMDVLGIDGAKAKAIAVRRRPRLQNGSAPSCRWPRKRDREGDNADGKRRGGDKDGKDERSKWVGVYIGVLAVLLAICNVGGANATKDATHSNIAAANTWAFFQAKNIRRNVDRPCRRRPRADAGRAAGACRRRRRRSSRTRSRSYRAQYQSAHHRSREARKGSTSCSRRPRLLEIGARRGAAQGPLFRLEPGAAADRHRAGLRAPDHRQLVAAGAQRRRWAGSARC